MPDTATLDRTPGFFLGLGSVTLLIGALFVACAMHWLTPEGLSNTLRWRTGAENARIVGYDVYRAQRGRGPFERITSEPVPRSATGTYQFEDRAITGRTQYYYVLEAVGESGQRRRFDDVMASRPKLATLADRRAEGLALTGLVLAVMLLTIGLLRRWSPVGDEYEYLKRAAAADPMLPGLFVRVPLHILLIRGASRHGRRPFGARLVTALIGFAAMGAMIGTALALAAPQLIIALAVLLTFEFGVYALRLWPEALLGLLNTLVLTCIIVATPTLECALGLGLICALSAATRLEQAVLAPAAGLAWSVSGQPLGLGPWAALLGPTVVMLLALTWRNWQRYRIPWPDTTWQFNAAIALHEATTEASMVTHTESSVQAIVGRWRSGAGYPSTTLSLRFAIRMVVDLFRRLIAVVGKETFIRDRLLPPRGTGFRAVRAPGFVDAWLRWGFSALVVAAVTAAVLADYWPAYLIPGAALLLAATAFHTRTRYRQMLVPSLFVWLADSGARIPPEHHFAAAGLAISLIVLLGFFSTREED